MSNRKKVIILIVFACVAYISRFYMVNQNDGMTAIHYKNDDEIIHTNNLEIKVENQYLYDMAALIKKYPDVEEYYMSMYAMRRQSHQDTLFLANDEYVMCVELVITNCSNRLQEIDYTGFHIYAGNSYFNGVDLMLFGAINQFSGLSLRAKHSYKLIMPYALNRDSFKKQNYDRLQKLSYSMLLSGYPDIKRVHLNHIQYEMASSKEKSIWKKRIYYNPKADEEVAGMLKATPTGSVTKKGDTYIQDNLKFTVEKCIITRNVYREINAIEGWQDVFEVKGQEMISVSQGPYDMLYFFRQQELDASQKKLKRNTHTTKNNYAVLVTLHIENTTNEDQLTMVNPGLVNYDGKGEIGTLSMAIGEGITHQALNASISVKQGAYPTITLLYKIEDYKGEKQNNRLWQAMDMPLYLDFGNGGEKDYLSKGICRKGKYVQIN